MNFFQRIFSKKEIIEEPKPPLIAVELPEQKIERVPWIEEDAELKDEAVVFGITSTDPNQKIAAIKSYFTGVIAPIAMELGTISQKNDEFGLKLNDLDIQKSKLQDKIAKIDQYKAYPTQGVLLHTVLALAAFIGFLSFYYLINFLLKNTDFQQPYASLGVLIVGVLGSALGWKETNLKNQIFEFLLPLVSSLVCYVFSYQSIGTAEAGSLAVFLFVGLLALGKFAVVRASDTLDLWANLIDNAWFELTHTQRYKKLSKKLDLIKTNEESLRAERWQLLPKLGYAEAQLKNAEATRDRKISLFESEYQLALRAKSSLSKKQIDTILG